MLSQIDILRMLAERDINQGQIAKVLGVSTSNANKLYKPAAKTGKTRRLSFDEGVALVRAFQLDPADDTSAVAPMSLPVARLAVQYVAQQLGVRIDPDDARVEDLALDIQAYSELAASSQLDENLDEARGWLKGRGSRQAGRP